MRKGGTVERSLYADIEPLSRCSNTNQTELKVKSPDLMSTSSQMISRPPERMAKETNKPDSRSLGGQFKCPVGVILSICGGGAAKRRVFSCLKGFEERWREGEGTNVEFPPQHQSFYMLWHKRCSDVTVS